MNEDKLFFVWLKCLGKPWPQLWWGDQINSANGKCRYSEDEILFKRELTTEERNLNLDTLCKKYPAPERKENASVGI